MAEQEAINILKFPDRFSLIESIEAVLLAEKALKNEQRRKELIEEYEKAYDNPELLQDENWSEFALAILRQCEAKEVEE